MKKLRQKASNLKLSIKGQIYLLLGILIVFYAIEVIDLLLRPTTGIHIDNLGIQPRTLWGLIGIPLSPFLHKDFLHLMANTLPFFILGYLVLLSGRETFFNASAIIVLVGGFGVWIFGSSATHIGASGLIYGFLGFILVRAYLDKKLIWIVIAVVTGLFYSGLLFGLFNVFKDGTSWAGHFYGLVAGALAAYALRNRKPESQPAISTSKKSPTNDDDEVDVEALLAEFRKNHPDA